MMAPTCYGCAVIAPCPPVDMNFYKNPASLTTEEIIILQKLKDAWDHFIKLEPKMDEDFTREFNDAIHRCQQIIALRVAQRADPLVWRQPNA